MHKAFEKMRSPFFENFYRKTDFVQIGWDPGADWEKGKGPGRGWIQAFSWQNWWTVSRIHNVVQKQLLKPKLPIGTACFFVT